MQTTESRITLYDGDALTVLIADMARQTAALLKPAAELVVIGILRRGAPLADRLCEQLKKRGVVTPRRLDLSVKRYADDLTLLHPQTQLLEPQNPQDLDLRDKTLLVVDDVLYTGHSLLRVLDYLVGKQPAVIHVAVLADRHAEVLPVHANVVGAHLQIPAGGIVECHVPPFETDFCIELVVPRRGAEAF